MENTSAVSCQQIRTIDIIPKSCNSGGDIVAEIFSASGSQGTENYKDYRIQVGLKTKRQRNMTDEKEGFQEKLSHLF